MSLAYGVLEWKKQPPTLPAPMDNISTSGLALRREHHRYLGNPGLGHGDSVVRNIGGGQGNGHCGIRRPRWVRSRLRRARTFGIRTGFSLAPEKRRDTRTIFPEILGLSLYARH